MSTWQTVCLDADDIAPLGRLRCSVAVEVCEHEGRVWLRGKDVEGELEEIFRTLPGRRFEILPDQQLLPAGSRVPKGFAPIGRWMAISEWMTLRLESAALAGEVTQRIKLRIVRARCPQEANVIWALDQAWTRFVGMAPQIRLDRLAFAMSQERGVVIRGTPLPPILGRRMVESNGICVEAGWTWKPSIDSDVIRDRLGLESDDLAVFDSDGSWERIPGGDFVRASRSAVRLSMRANQ